MIDKPFSESCEQNREPILAVLREVFADRHRLLEIGSGTGQHAVAFGAELPHLRWQTGDMPLHHPGIRMWLDAAALPNVLPPISLDVNQKSWRDGRYDAVFSANTLHIMRGSNRATNFSEQVCRSPLKRCDTQDRFFKR